MEQAPTPQLAASVPAAIPKILIVEDDPVLPETIADALGEGFDTMVARSVPAAFAAILARRPDLVLCDVMLPGISGVELCRRLKRSPEHADLIVVLLTGLSCRDTMLEGWKAGADEYLLKPFYPEELIVRINGLLAVRRARREGMQVETLKAKERFQREFIANISHELRTPIAAIKGFAETLRQRGAARRRRDFARRIELQADRLSRVVDDLLTVASLEAAGDAGWSGLSLSDLLEEVCRRSSGAAEKRRVRLFVDAEPELTVRGDRDQLRRVLENLLEHALRSSRRSGDVRVEAREAGGSALVSVRDAGPRIPAAHLDRVFDHFFRGSRGRSPDSGLGLSLVRRVVEAHGGKVWAESGGEGSTIRLSLPLRR